MKKGFFFGVLAIIIIVLSCSPVSAGQESLYSENGENPVAEYRIFENFVEFDGSVYKYDLNSYFDKGDIRYISYEIVSTSNSGIVTVEGNVMSVAPVGNFNGDVKIKATDRNGDAVYAVFILRFINAPAYISDKLNLILIILLVVFLLLHILTAFAVPIKGNIRIEILGSGEHTVISRRLLGYMQIPSGWPVKGCFVGKSKNNIKFIPKRNTAVYKKTADGVVKVTSEMIFRGETGYYFYSGKLCSEDKGVNIYFY